MGSIASTPHANESPSKTVNPAYSAGIAQMARKLSRPHQAAPRPRHGRKAVAFLLILAAITIGYFVWRTVRPLPVDVAIVSYQRAGAAAQPIIRQSGYVTYPHMVTIGNTAPGVVRRIHFEEGDAVERGDLLATFEIDELLAQRTIQEAAYADAQKTLARTQTLHAAGAVSAIDMQQAETALETVQAELDLLTVRIESGRVRAPFTGRILERLADVGERAPQGICVLVDDSKTLVEIEISQDDLSKLNPQQPALVILDAYPETEYAARLLRLSPMANRTTHAIQTEVEVLKPDSRILPNLSARVYLVEESREDNFPVRSVLALDRSAVVEEDALSFVWVVKGDRTTRSVVETGAPIGADLIEIRSGLEPEQIVIRNPSLYELQEGRRVLVRH